MSNIKNVITHLYKADVEVPVQVTVDIRREDEVSTSKMFMNINSANDYINNKEYEDEVSSLVECKQTDISDELVDEIDVSYDLSDEVNTEVRAVPVDDLCEYEVNSFLRSNPDYQMTTVEITAQLDDSSTEMKKMKVFVQVVQDQKVEVNDQRVSS